MTDQSLSAFDLPVPVYLDQRIVFDMLATLEDGFYQLSTVRTASTESDMDEASVKGGIGLSNVFAFVRVGMEADRARSRSTRDESHVERQRVHTPTSIFARLRLQLRERHLIIDLADIKELRGLETGALLEFKGVLRQHPILAAIETPREFSEMLAARVGQNVPPKQAPGGRRQPETRAAVKPQPGPYDELLRDFLESDKRELLCAPTSGPQLTAVLATDLGFYVDRDMASVIDGEYRILGKIERILPVGSGEAINLLKRTPLSIAPDEYTQLLRSWVADMAGLGLKMPADLTTAVPAPALQIRPLAIFT